MVLITTSPKAIVLEDTAVGSTPVLLKLTVCGLLVELLVMVSVPAGCAPGIVGVSCTITVQLAPEASAGVIKHVDEELIEYGEPALTVSEVRLTEDAPVFLNVTVCDALAVPTTTFPNGTDAGETVVCPKAAAEVNRPKITIKDGRKTLRQLRTRSLARLNMVLPPNNLVDVTGVMFRFTGETGCYKDK